MINPIIALTLIDDTPTKDIPVHPLFLIIFVAVIFYIMNKLSHISFGEGAFTSNGPSNEDEIEKRAIRARKELLKVTDICRRYNLVNNPYSRLVYTRDYSSTITYNQLGDYVLKMEGVVTTLSDAIHQNIRESSMITPQGEK